MDAHAKLNAMRSQPLSLGMTTGSGTSLAGMKRCAKTYGGARNKKKTAKEKRENASKRAALLKKTRYLLSKPNVYVDPAGVDVKSTRLFVPGRSYSNKMAAQNFRKLMTRLGQQSKKKAALDPDSFFDGLDEGKFATNMMSSDGSWGYPLRNDFMTDVDPLKNKSINARKRQICEAYGLTNGKSWEDVGSKIRKCKRTYLKRIQQPTFPKGVEAPLKDAILSSLLGKKYDQNRAWRKRMIARIAKTQGARVTMGNQFYVKPRTAWQLKVKQVAEEHKAKRANGDPDALQPKEIMAEAKRQYDFENLTDDE